MGDPIPSQLDILRLCFRLRCLEGDELEEAIAELEEWLNKRPAWRMSPTKFGYRARSESFRRGR